jgi:hypothetical protein
MEQTKNHLMAAQEVEDRERSSVSALHSQTDCISSDITTAHKQATHELTEMKAKIPLAVLQISHEEVSSGTQNEHVTGLTANLRQGQPCHERTHALGLRASEAR